MSDFQPWLPDGRGLAPEAVEINAEMTVPIPVHLRLTSPKGRSERGLCGSGFGDWWTGVLSEVTCTTCLRDATS